MKRTWVVLVEAGVEQVGHNRISDTHFWGPFTRKRAEKLVEKLNKVLPLGGVSKEIARAMPLDNEKPKRIVKNYNEK